MDECRAVAISMVVGFHALGYVTVEGAAASIILFFVQTIAVPVFFLVDGFLMMRRVQVNFAYGRFLRQSARRLLVPWVIFSVLYLVARYVFELTGMLETKLIIGHSLGQIAVSVYASHIAPQMYFLLSLFAIRVFSFAIQHLSKIPTVYLAILAATYAAVFRIFEGALAGIFAPGLDPILHALWGFQYYLFGTVLFRVDWFFSGKRIAISGLICVVVLGLLLVVADDHPVAAAIIQYSFMLATYCAAKQWSGKISIIAAMGRDTMGIYLLHAPVILNITAKTVCAALGSGVVSYVVVVFAVVMLSWISAQLIIRARLGFVFGNSKKKRSI